MAFSQFEAFDPLKASIYVVGFEFKNFDEIMHEDVYQYLGSIFLELFL
jgi:hypothetical protein